MNNSVRRGAAGLAAGVAVVGLLAGCGDKVVKKGDLQSQIKEKVSAAATGSKVGDVKCDDNLKAKVKASTDCTVEIDGKKQQITAVVDKVDGDKVSYSIKRKG
ncbi:MAG TPA: DUF4333 domain-containing protein [Flexivirga sp.]|uniref:DUF4333 domain-containing protein n=1 Tax=Flexivirga sp. TaxID=1962927 RepID=UPI002C12CAC7|nr:DUF4333 domain-containing protein [Flexivirga sp.]HWC21172.1 DUF4333 domain-containing protein [Flexivirga sp.]